MITAPEVRRRNASAPITGKYLSLTSYRRDGTGVSTPVWFVSEGDRLLVQTDGDSYKVGRIRRDPHVSIAPCSARGTITGETVEALAEVRPWDAERFGPMQRDKYRIESLLFRAARVTKEALHLGTPHDDPVLLEITPI
jgi:PPOX class probable F420-dependent enzyme